MKHNVYIYLLILAGVSYIIRVLPLTLITKKIKNKFLRSFLYYVPYVTLAVMTFPAILEAANSPIAGALALLAGVILAWCGGNLIQVATLCCMMVFLVELIIK